MDATVEVKINKTPNILKKNTGSYEEFVLPLELKTGKLYSKLGKTHPLNFPCVRKLEISKKTHDFRVDELFPRAIKRSTPGGRLFKRRLA